MTHASTLTAPTPEAAIAPPLASPRLARADALPEHVEYRDSGCDMFPSCLRCPLPRCRYDEPGGARAMLNRVRDREIRRMRLDDGVPVNEIARRVGVSRRTVFRALEGTQRTPPAASAQKEATR